MEFARDKGAWRGSSKEEEEEDTFDGWLIVMVAADVWNGRRGGD